MVRVLKGEAAQGGGRLQGSSRVEPGKGEMGQVIRVFQERREGCVLGVQWTQHCARERAAEGGGGPNHKAPWNHLRAFWVFFLLNAKLGCWWLGNRET